MLIVCNVTEFINEVLSCSYKFIKDIHLEELINDEINNLDNFLQDFNYNVNHPLIHKHQYKLKLSLSQTDAGGSLMT